jgi:hypothetical protein
MRDAKIAHFRARIEDFVGGNGSFVAAGKKPGKNQWWSFPRVRQAPFMIRFRSAQRTGRYDS